MKTSGNYILKCFDAELYYSSKNDKTHNLFEFQLKHLKCDNY